MYAQYFGLHEKPFSIAPDPRYLYQSERHAEALAHLVYGIKESGGFIQLTGEVGTGKTTLTRALLSHLPKNVEVAMILNPRLSAKEFLQAICKELNLKWPVWRDSIRELIDVLNDHLLKVHAQGHRVVLIIDEAQNLDVDLLEQIRLLTNLETAERKLLQIILIGQPELRQTLDRPDLRQLAQRITARYHLEPLTREETGRYISHRLQIAGASREIFTASAIREIHRLSGGVPRLINIICDRAMLGAFSREHPVVDPKLVRQAAAEVKGSSKSSRKWPARAAVAATIAGVGIAGIVGLQYWRDQRPVDAATAILDPGQARMSATLPGVSGSPGEITPAADNAVTEPAGTGGPAVAATDEDLSEPGETVFDLEELLAGTRDLTNNQIAFEQLFRLWDKAYVATSTRACDQAAAQGLKCLFQRGSWNHLVTLNLPAILSLTDATGEDHQVVLQALRDAETVVLRIGESSYPVALDQVVNYWFGDSLLLWRPHPRADRVLAFGARGAGVKWLREGLDKLQQSDAGSADPMLYDAELVERVKVFQRENGLRVDGIAGVRTLVKLQSMLVEPGVPLLQKDG